MRAQYYRATKRINKTALLEFLKKEKSKNKDLEIKVCEVSGVVFLKTPQPKLLERVDELYPNIFKPSGPPLLEGIVLFNNP
jgi:hypothetical protein